jgi:hypothetical protein
LKAGRKIELMRLPGNKLERRGNGLWLVLRE